VGGALYTNLDYDSFDLYVEKTVFKVGNPNANNYGITRQGRTGRATHVSADGDHIRAISAAKGSGDTEFSLCPYCFDLDRAADDVIVNREFLKFIYSKGTVEIRQLIEQKFPDVSLEPEYFEFKEDSRILSHYGELPFCIGINNAIVPNEFSRKSLYVQEDYTASIGTALNGKNQYITFKKK